MRGPSSCGWARGGADPPRDWGALWGSLDFKVLGAAWRPGQLRNLGGGLRGWREKGSQGCRWCGVAGMSDGFCRESKRKAVVKRQARTSQACRTHHLPKLAQSTSHIWGQRSG